jgi:hypothetical protein
LIATPAAVAAPSSAVLPTATSTVSHGTCIALRTGGGAARPSGTTVAVVVGVTVDVLDGATVGVLTTVTVRPAVTLGATA